ncbi:3-keto-5-aminohexanoate cleavage protein [Rhizobium giardinii]|uniref:3-keto-5-aminohexanoate cleavage enzyme n=1 Tax=Rhizobium giardinii TaxID=56731 RepID=A0A7W8UBM9_9HYPH|nr:3-keto-5-aminohexanoate cleavage protein [Rhizobium giardinii]MBB5536396.1 3-keto-5-aminohexanoate cleavage enzyme [Rhizobium giardinii]
MDKLIITVTCDSDSAYPGNPNNPTPKGMDTVVKEYLGGIDAGAAISHIHGPRKLDDAPQPDGSRLSSLQIPGWGRMQDAILSQRDTIMQFGIAGGRFDQRKELIRTYAPDMLSVAFVAHDECFDYDPSRVPKEIYGIHSRTELEEYCTLCNELGIKIEVEAFHTGGFWNAQRMINKGLLPQPVWITCFFGWKGGAWTPPTADAVLYMKSHLPKGANWNGSTMDPDEHWNVLTSVILAGGHVRVGMEDNPFIRPGEYARTNAELVDKIVRISRELGREIASPDEAREIIGLKKRAAQSDGGFKKYGNN